MDTNNSINDTEVSNLIQTLNNLSEWSLFMPNTQLEIRYYTIISKAMLQQNLDEIKHGLKVSLFNTSGALGKGMYFYENNLEYVKKIALNKGLAIIEAKLGLRNCIDLSDPTSIKILYTLLKKLSTQGIELKSDSDLLEQLKISADKSHQIDSARSIHKHGKQIGKSSIQEFMGNIVCIYNSDCILSISNPLKND